MTENPKLLAISARDRAWRTFLQGLAFDVLAAIIIVLYPVFTQATGWGDFQWALIGFALFKSIMMSMLAYLMRRGLNKQLPPVD